MGVMKLIFSVVLFFAMSSQAAMFCKDIWSARPSAVLDAASHLQVERYLTDTLSSLNRMRGQNGFVSDTISVQHSVSGRIEIKTLVPHTSPTNIAVDLLVQLELLARPEYRKQSLQILQQALLTLGKADYHKATGLFFTRYSTDLNTAVKDFSVSAIDNMHLALTLWTLRQTLGETQLGRAAGELFSRMDFSVYYEQKTGLIGGNLRPGKEGWV